MTTPRNPRTISWRSLTNLLTQALDGLLSTPDRWALEKHAEKIAAARRLSREAVRLARLGLEWKVVAEEQHEIVRAYRARDRARAELYALAARDSFGIDTLRRATESLEAARATLTKHGEPHP